MLIDEFDMYTALRQPLHRAEQIVKSVRQTVQAMHAYSVTGASEVHQQVRLPALDIVAQCAVAEAAANLDAFQLPFRILYECTGPDRSTRRSNHAGLPTSASMFSIKRLMALLYVSIDSASSRTHATNPRSLITS